MGYQSFDEDEGHSRSGDKLKSIKIPQDLSGKSVLDIGCNEGFFCVQAKKRGASYVLGVDTHPPFIETALQRADQCDADVDFIVGNIFNVSGKRFDVILVLSVLHYIKNPKLFSGILFHIMG